jgi:SAM-dependent methyltransferase
MDPHGFYKVMPRPSDEELETYYRTAYQNPCIPHDPRGRADLLTAVVPSPGRVLDIGCGNGEFLAELKDRGWEVVGVEPGAEYAERARALGIPVYEELLTAENIGSLGRFDAVALMHVLEHLPHPERMVDLVRRMLVPGGVFYCEVPNDFNPLQEAVVDTGDIAPWWIALPDHLNYFSVRSLAVFLEAHGFTVETSTTDFPVELFLLWGDHYVGDPEKGREMHQKRCRFEAAMRQAGKAQILHDLYRAIAPLQVGREAIAVARLR